MALLTYPDNLESRGTPWLLFTAHRPHYKNRGGSRNGKIDSHTTDNSVALHVPQGFSVADSLQYETHAAGALGAVMNAWQEGGADMDPADIEARLMKGAGAAAVGEAAKGLSNISPAATGIAAAVRQRSQNPHEFMTFKSPGIRSFSLSFKFIPKNEGEARTVPQIIKFFRLAAYPTRDDIDYIFPDTFTITAGRTSSMIRLSEVACTGITTTYNPNSLSYFVYQNMASEIDLALTFQELLPIDRSMIAAGY